MFLPEAILSRSEFAIALQNKKTKTLNKPKQNKNKKQKINTSKIRRVSLQEEHPQFVVELSLQFAFQSVLYRFVCFRFRIVLAFFFYKKNNLEIKSTKDRHVNQEFVMMPNF